MAEAAALVTAARVYEAAGVEGVWSPQLFGAPFSTLSAVGAVTDRLKLGTGIALAFVRSPLETACSDAMVESIAIIGNADEVARRMEQRARDANSITPVVPHYDMSADKVAEYARRIAEVFYG